LFQAKNADDANTSDLAELIDETEYALNAGELNKPRIVVSKAASSMPDKDKPAVTIITPSKSGPGRASMPNDEEYIASDEELKQIFSEKATIRKPEMFQDDDDAIVQDVGSDIEEISKAVNGNRSSIEAAKALLGLNEKKYKRVFIPYWGEKDVDKYQEAARKIQARIDGKNPLTGVVINSARGYNAKKGSDDIRMQVLLDDESMQCIPVWIESDEMTLSYSRISENRKLGFKESFGRRVIGTRIQFMPKSLHIGNVEATESSDKQYAVIGSRVDYLSQMRRRFLDDPNSPDLLQQCSLVEGVVVAVYANRILFNVAGVDLLLWTTIPYITGVAHLADTDIYGGKKLFRKNEKKECVIDGLKRDGNGVVNGIHLNFRAPLRAKIHEIASTLEHGNYLQGTILRYARGPAINGQEGREFAIVKCSVGIEAACPIPAWTVLPPVGSDVTLKVVFVDSHDRVYGHAKRNS